MGFDYLLQQGIDKNLFAGIGFQLCFDGKSKFLKFADMKLLAS